MGYILDHKNQKLNDILCMKWECKFCRSVKRYLMYIKCLNAVYSYNLNRHMVITFPGKSVRKNVSFIDSYKKLSYSWKKFKQVIQYHQGPFSYIVFPRSQSDGYCHYHILLNKYINWYYLNKQRIKHNLGYLSIQKGDNVLEYLSIDFWKDYEWYLPKGKKRVFYSRDILINNNISDKYSIYQNFLKLQNLQKYILYKYGWTFDIDQYCLDKLKKPKSI